MYRKLALLLLGSATVIGTLEPKHRGSAEIGTAMGFSPAIPMTWGDKAMATLFVPLADPRNSPKEVSADYYYKIPVRPIYKSYLVYAPGHEPPGYVDWLKEQEPVIVWDDKGHAPSLKTEADWIKAGEIVFDSAVLYGPLYGPETFDSLFVRQPDFYAKTGTPVDKDGTVPFFRYIVTEKGKVRISSLACAMCHTRVMPDGTIIKGAQGSFPFDRVYAYQIRAVARSPEGPRDTEHLLFAAPWVRPDPQTGLEQMSADTIASMHEAIPPGVLARHGTNSLFPAQVPDLIGVRDRHYLDRTGLQQHRSIVDLMRYSALNQGGDILASYPGFAPFGDHLPDPDKFIPRYSDEQLYALALYVYSLKPPKNPNKFDALAVRGQKVFNREGCRTCHTPPLYTSNMLTPVDGFTPPPDAYDKFDVLLKSVGTDPSLALKTRRGTGYYKVPSLRGVWYRSMFGHSGWCATLEDWLDPRRQQDDFVPSGFMPYGAKTYAVKGHRFGLLLSDGDKKALIAFLKTL